MAGTTTCLLRFVLLSALAASACGGDDGDDDHGHGEESAADGGDDDLEEVPCGPEYPPFQLGMSTTAKEVTLKLVASDRGAPRQYVNNDWTFDVLGADQQPAANVQIVKAETFMPAHGHYTRPDPSVEKLAGPGQYRLDNVRFRMPGPWDVRLYLKIGEVEETGVLRICVE